MFQPLSAYTVAPQQMQQQQQNLVDALRGNAAPVGAPVMQGSAPTMPTTQGGAPILSTGRGLGQLFNGRAVTSGLARLIGSSIPPAQGGG